MPLCASAKKIQKIFARLKKVVMRAAVPVLRQHGHAVSRVHFHSAGQARAAGLNAFAVFAPHRQELLVGVIPEPAVGADAVIRVNGRARSVHRPAAKIVHGSLAIPMFMLISFVLDGRII